MLLIERLDWFFLSEKLCFTIIGLLNVTRTRTVPLLFKLALEKNISSKVLLYPSALIMRNEMLLSCWTVACNWYFDMFHKL